MAGKTQLPSFAQSVRGIGLPAAAVEAIEQLQQHLTSVYSGEAFQRYGNSILSGGIGGGGSTGGGLGGADDETPDYTPPPAPVNLTAAGGYASVLLRWNPSTDSRIGYIEVLRAAVDNPGVATVVGTTSGNIFPDQLQNAQSFFYWVRNTNKWNPAIKSPLNATAGTLAATAPDVEYLLGLLTGDGAEKPFYAVEATTTINGVVIQPGVYMKNLFAKAAVVELFTAGLAVIDSASIISLTADKIETDSLVAKLGTFNTGMFQTIFATKAFIQTANIGDGQITNAKIGAFIQSTNFDGYEGNPGSQGWYIGKSGLAYFNNVTVRGNITGSSINGSTITGSTINGTTLNAPTINGAVISAGILKSAGGSPRVQINLDATGALSAFQVGVAPTDLIYYGPSFGFHLPVEIHADGTAFFGKAVTVARTPVASSTGYAIPTDQWPAYIVPTESPPTGGGGGI